MRDMLKMIIVLSAICACSGLVLAFIKQATAERIEIQELTFVKGPALASVFGDTDNDPIKDRTTVDLPDGQSLLVFPARSKGSLKAVAFELHGPGYGGDIGIMVGFDAEADQLMGIGLTTHKETPGVGSRAAEPAFTDQFRAHPLAGIALTTAGGRVNAVTGATISSTGVTGAVAKAAELYTKNKAAILAALEGQG